MFAAILLNLIDFEGLASGGGAIFHLLAAIFVNLIGFQGWFLAVVPYFSICRNPLKTQPLFVSTRITN